MNPDVPRISIGWNTIQAVTAHKVMNTIAEGIQRRVIVAGVGRSFR